MPEGVGSQYMAGYRDSEDNFLDGNKNYRLHIPPNVPVKDFWSIVAYDPSNRSQLQTGQPYPALNSQFNMDKNADGSVDIYFGAKAPKGKENNWIQTVPGKGWFIVFRFYGPLKAYTDKTWKPDDVVLVK